MYVTLLLYSLLFFSLGVCTLILRIKMQHVKSKRIKDRIEGCGYNFISIALLLPGYIGLSVLSPERREIISRTLLIVGIFLLAIILLVTFSRKLKSNTSALVLFIFLNISLLAICLGIVGLMFFLN
ncbi:hypothetical protein [Tengunoibacter tsumagoiensis]|uniref:hypothetical protein n=1 Tax=Tengunoibacter tsumagoiensis TaxID=2014871 RepID=UPI000F84C969|nr:hypothetical protein [Tengunoibacter tsumagoiensis]